MGRRAPRGLLLLLLPALLSIGGAGADVANAAGGPVRPGVIPAQYVSAVLRGLAVCPRLTPSLIAAQVQAESGWKPDVTGHGGALGVAQLRPDEWHSFLHDEDGDGKADPLDAQDAVPALARIDCAHADALAHTPGNPVANMLAAYDAGLSVVRNFGGVPPIPETQDYVTQVLFLAQSNALPLGATNLEAYALPLAQAYMPLGRTDLGVDIEAAPVGATVYSMCSGVVTLIGQNGPLGVPWGFGPNYPIIRCTSGSLNGRAIYYGHVGVSLVRAGDAVTAGQPIAELTHIDGAGPPGQGHIEIGFDNGIGVPTGEGPAMRTTLIGLGATFGLQLS